MNYLISKNYPSGHYDALALSPSSADAPPFIVDETKVVFEIQTHKPLPAEFDRDLEELVSKYMNEPPKREI